MDLHTIVDRAQRIIVSQLKPASAECHILFVKDRVDETTITRVPELAKELLPPDRAAIVLEAHKFLKRAVDELCLQYLRYTVGVGKLYGVIYKVNQIDTSSLAPEALYKASIRFKPKEESTPETRVPSFKAYISFWVRQNVQRSVPRTSVKMDDGTYYLSREVYTLNSALTDGDSTCHIDQLTEEDTLWGGCQSLLNNQEAMEELREQYCPHLTMEEMVSILHDPDKASEFIEALS